MSIRSEGDKSGDGEEKYVLCMWVKKGDPVSFFFPMSASIGLELVGRSHQLLV